MLPCRSTHTRGNARQEKITFQLYHICQLFTVFLMLATVTVAGMAVPNSEEDPTIKARPVDLGSAQGPHHQHNVKMLSRGEEKDEGIVAVVTQGEEPLNPLPRMQAVELLLQKYKQMSGEPEEAVTNQRTNNARALWSDDFQRRASELCGTSASLECGKRILSVIEGQEGELSVHMKCDLRDDFLKCIDTEKKGCLELAKSSVLPELPPKEVIKVEQSKLWKVLWTAGGCILANY